jgi:hypothetical protein
MPQPQTQKRTFQMHPALLRHVIGRQAGNLGKAVLEGVMNSIDAGATRVDITLSEAELTIVDNGRGFTEPYEIDQYFETFGTPQTEEEKRFGRFRMGRGQMFSYGRNYWRSGPFRMEDIDIDNRGYDWTLVVEPTIYYGCIIRVELYAELVPSQIAEARDAIRENCKYMDVEVRFNGQQINEDPATCQWTTQDDNAYYLFDKTAQLRIYNQGALVCTHPKYQYGVGGVVVSKKELMVNFARNDVMSTKCPVWQEIRKVLSAQAKQTITEKKTLDDSERQMLCNQVSSGQLEIGDYQSLKIFTPVTGRHQALSRIYSTAYNHRATVADIGDRRGEVVHRERLAYVFATECMQRFGHKRPKDFIVFLNSLTSYQKWEYTTLDELVGEVEASFEILGHDTLTDNERVWLSVMNCGCGAVRYGSRRDVKLGKADFNQAWTDGKTYIAVNRQFLVGKTPGDLNAITAIGLLLCHEYCHTEPDFGDHAHDPDFYAGFHERVETFLPHFVAKAFGATSGALAEAGKQATKKALRAADQAARIEQAKNKLPETFS